MGLKANTPVLGIFLTLCLTFISSRCSSRSKQGHISQPSGNQIIKMAVQPQCGDLSSDKFVNFNTGINLDQIKTIYSFGDSWTTNGNSEGGVAKPAVAKGDSSLYGLRPTNGPVWTEDLASDGKILKNYAVGGATLDHNLWKARATKTDMIGHVDNFLKQKLTVDSDSSLATIFYGINDYSASLQGPGNFEDAEKQLLNQTERLINAGIKKFIVVSPPFDKKQIKSFESSTWNGFKKLKESKNIEFAYIDLVALFSAILANPSSFGYQSVESCLKSLQTTVGRCKNPEVYLYWIPSHPQVQTHRLIADWVRAVLKNCQQKSSNRSKYARIRRSIGDRSPESFSSSPL
ncbi:hypothetical protein PTTG_08259 [Puccinia triticina 1-1 BBBD Race 1]|uniref:Lipase_GDSL domain-containing protein n=2 Tax=Puccinia triticina TaxID=208348 RepID=A0A180G957_PUCT1|nr:uncharacterized protein PtA15_6A508 [Puccinia triticina]OAV89039.1 hypothetical protein PTTG_08259 [Puccinia triticina 1-1 BBBD Race 1]WAQ85879.1 hypothetical protein PtA15_6A508 [Puccinia triticina]WAR55772.1 hypothetical protein PtB15_6B515 [Puccinia triticina]